MFRSASRFDTPFAFGPCPFACPPEPSGPTTFRSTATELGLHAGPGLGVRLGRAQLFGAMRLQSFGSSAPGNVVPVVFGVRF